MENVIDEYYLPLFVVYQEDANLSQIKLELDQKSEFDTTFVSFPKLPHGDLPFWNALVRASEVALEGGHDVIAICSIKHRFSSNYTSEILFEYLHKARGYNSSVLLLNTIAFDQAVFIDDGLYWINDFMQSDFIIIFSNLFNKICDVNFEEEDIFEKKLISLTNFVISLYPFFSVPEQSMFESGSLLKRISDITYMRFSLIELVNKQFSKNIDHHNLEIHKVSLDYSDRFTEYFASIKHYQTIKVKQNKLPIYVTHLHKSTTLKPENRIIVLVPFHNAEKYLPYCSNSIVKQDYQNFSVVFLDDYSSDDSLTQIPSHDKISIISTTKRLYALTNIHRYISTYEFYDEDIIIIVDGDDYLLHNQVFRKLNELYDQYGCLLTYGQYIYSDNRVGHCRAYTRNEFKDLRNSDWRVSHLKTFKYSLYKKFLSSDVVLDSYLDANGDCFTMSYDVAIMLPLLEIAGYDRVYFNSDIFYVYRLHDHNEFVIDADLQSTTNLSIFHKKPFVV